VATHRSPKGSYTRPTPDFFIDRACTVGGVYSPVPAVGAALDLYNNATEGSNLHVYKVFVGNDGSELYGITAIHGHGANFLQNGATVIVPGPTPFGQLYYDTVPAQWTGFLYPNNTALSDRLYGDNTAGSTDQWYAQGPICVLSPGYSLRVYVSTGTTVTSATPIAVSFYYLQLRDQG